MLCFAWAIILCTALVHAVLTNDQSARVVAALDGAPSGSRVHLYAFFLDPMNEIEALNLIQESPVPVAALVPRLTAVGIPAAAAAPARVRPPATMPRRAAVAGIPPAGAGATTLLVDDATAEVTGDAIVWAARAAVARRAYQSPRYSSNAANNPGARGARGRAPIPGVPGARITGTADRRRVALTVAASVPRDALAGRVVNIAWYVASPVPVLNSVGLLDRRHTYVPMIPITGTLNAQTNPCRMRWGELFSVLGIAHNTTARTLVVASVNHLWRRHVTVVHRW